MDPVFQISCTHFLLQSKIFDPPRNPTEGSKGPWLPTNFKLVGGSAARRCHGGISATHARAHGPRFPKIGPLGYSFTSPTPLFGESFLSPQLLLGDGPCIETFARLKTKNKSDVEVPFTPQKQSGASNAATMFWLAFSQPLCLLDRHSPTTSILQHVSSENSVSTS